MRRPLTMIVAAVAALSLAALPAAATDTGLDATAASAAPSSATPAVSRDILKARYGTFASKTLKGTGTKVLKLPKGATRGLVTVSARGKGTITVQVLKKNRKKQGRAVVAKQALPYAGTAVYGLELGQYDPTYLKVSSTSAKRWTVKVQPLHRAKAMKKKQKGSGDAVFRVTVTKPKKWSISYRSDVKKNFSVTTYGLIRSQVLVDKATAKYSGKVRVEDFSGFVVVRSQGRWTLKR